MSDIITVKNLSKSFKEIKAVDDISFTIKKGEIFGFLGPNGAGKSTTIKMLTTLLKPDTGSISMNGFDPLTQPHQVRQTFGIVFQDPSIDDELTAFENMEFHGVLYHIPRPLRRTRIEQLLKIVQLWDRRKDLTKRYSGGMKRRLEIARGLLHHPDILFLDEPTLGLDPQTRNHIWNHIRHMNQTENVTVFFTTHYMEEVERVAQRIAIIDHGRIINQGTAAELKQQTETPSLEDAFIALTGHDIRSEEINGAEYMKMRVRLFRK
ncbi:MAG: ATP-binding cassette domain-containing protein [Planctomycetes bacterium]|nr:ATP-binding cassette domain-containing protein [Planctomycetota bacterium]